MMSNPSFQPRLNDEIPEEIRDFAEELKTLTPWTPPVVLLRPETGATQTRNMSSRQTLSLGLLIGVFPGIFLGGTLVASFQKTVDPETVEIVRHVEIPVDPVIKRNDETQARIETSPQNAISYDLDIMIGAYNERAKTLAKVAGSTSSPVPELPDDPNAVYRLRESLKM